MNRYKVSNEGTYLSFPGLTVIARINAVDNPFWKKIYNIITKCQLLSEYFAPLSHSSYHMTTMSLFTEHSIGRTKWEQFVVSHKEYFKLLKADLEQNSFNPELTIKSIRVDRTVKLVVEVPAKQKKIITDIALKHNLLKKIPHPFHITLAYRYKSIENRIKFELEKELENQLNQLSQEYKITVFLNHPELCFFHDLNEFFPWSIAEYPFARS